MSEKVMHEWLFPMSADGTKYRIIENDQGELDLQWFVAERWREVLIDGFVLVELARLAAEVERLEREEA